MNITTVGLDLAKNIITVCALNAQGDVVVRRNVSFAKCAEWLQQLPANCVVGMEACGTAHYWGRKLQAMGLQPRIMAAEFVAPFRQSVRAKNDNNDAHAIAIAVQQPHMRFVSVKTELQQTRLVWHCLREGWKAERTALINRARGLLLEFGFPLPKSTAAFFAGVVEAQVDERLPESVRDSVLLMTAQLRELERLMTHCEKTIARAVKHDKTAQQLCDIHGVGALTADAICASVGNVRDFKNGRQFAAWMGLVPRQYSSGGKTKLGRITKRGDAYLRCVLVQGARSSLQSALKKEPLLRNHEQRWMTQLRDRIGFQKTLVAIANKHARQIWAMMSKGEDYNPDAWKQYQHAA